MYNILCLKGVSLIPTSSADNSRLPKFNDGGNLTLVYPEGQNGTKGNSSFGIFGGKKYPELTTAYASNL